MDTPTCPHRLALLVGGASLRDRGPLGPTGTKSKQAVDQETSQEPTKIFDLFIVCSHQI